jgi:hypothetical protein
MVSLGMGLGAFAQGMGQGMQMAQQVKGVLRDKKLHAMEQDATAAGTAAREADIAKAIQTTTGANGAQSFSVGGQQFSDAGQARNAAAQQVGTVMDYYRNQTVPKLIEGYMKMGDAQKASALQSWVETEDANNLTKDWARATRMALLGDNKAAMRGFGKLYEKLEPGSKYVGMEDITEPVYEERKLPKTGETIRVEAGTRPVGVRLKLKSADGEEVTHDFGSTEDLFQTAMLTLSPDKFVGRAFAEVDKAQASRAAAAKDAREFGQDVQMKRMDAVIADQRDQRQHERSIIRDDRQFAQTTARDDRQFAQQSQRDATLQGYDLEKITTSKQMDAALAPSMEAAKAKGDTAEDARKAIAGIWKNLSTNSLPGKDGFNAKPVEEQIEQAARIYRQQSTVARGVVAGAKQESQSRGIPKLW